MELFLDLLRSVVYGVIEGITEWLPISSTGHMILAEQVLKFSLSAEFMEMFRVVIQLGAIMAVVVLYFKKLWPFCGDNGCDSGLAKHIRWPVLRLWLKIIVACLPAAVLGLLLDDWMDAHLYNSVVVALSDEETLTDAIATDEEAKDGVLVVLDKTPFYAEMGGQAADHGVLNGAECSLRVLDVKKTPKGYYVHTCVLESGIVKVGDVLTAQVDKGYRMAIARNHTATHLLQAALREVLGDHVHQAGSYQDASITHFDFTHFSAVTPEELARVQKIVNDKIFDSMNVTVQEMPVEEAKKLGAMALFGEKYGKVVRVVDIEGWSTEFCGGTHVKNTAQIGGFKIVSESSVAAGIRRIEAVTGRNLLIRANLQEAMLHDVANTLKANNVAALPARAEAVMAENKAMSRELEEMKAKIAASKVDSLFDNAEEADGVKIASAYFTGTTGDTLRGMCDSIRDKAVNPVVAVLVGKAEDKITMAVTVNKLAQEKGLKAGVLVKELSAIAGGKGGGKPDSAMGGGTEVSKVDDALAAVDDLILSKLG